MAVKPLGEEAIFKVATELSSEAVRNVYLRQVCADDLPLFNRVLALLKAREEDPEFLEVPASAATAAVDIPASLLGTQIGPYLLREQIGEGGMGEVYVAEQTEPLRRKVALKIIRPGMASRDVVARFEAERQTLAMMDHPHIAKVLDGGQTESGQPYFVMELVQGQPITEYCDAHELSTRHRLELFITVCRAVQHAHQKGIIHRDIKPSNVLVPRIDGSPVPKVIDFGVAKAVGQKLAAKTVYTQFSQLVGTPLYMSPEQAELGVVDVDTRSDVYSLGVLLYELLTGSPPFDSETLKQAGFDEMRRIIREEEPPLPSARVSTLNAEAISTVAKQRDSDPRQLRQSLQGELDWIAMQALEKDRNRRYESPSALAEDVSRFLVGDSVSACPPSLAYRIRVLFRRQKVAASLILLAAIAAIALIVSMIAIARTAQRERDMTRLANRERRSSEENFIRAMNSVDHLIDYVSNDLTHIPGTQQLQEAMLLDALAFYEELSGGGNGEPDSRLTPTLRHQAARALLHVGAISEQLGRAEQAEFALEESKNRLESLVADYPDVAEYQRTLADNYASLAYRYMQSRMFNEQLQYTTSRITLLEQLATDSPEDLVLRKKVADAHMNMAHAYRYMGRPEEAEVHARQSLRTIRDMGSEDSPEVASAHHWLGAMLKDLQRTDAAEQHLAEAVRVRELLLQDTPDSPQCLASLAHAKCYLADIVVINGDVGKGIELYRHAQAIREKLCSEYPYVYDHARRLNLIYAELGPLLQKSGQHEQANEIYRAAIKHLHKVHEAFPDASGDPKGDLARIHSKLGQLYFSQGLLTEASEEFQSAATGFEAAVNDRPKDISRLRGFSHFLMTCPIQEFHDLAKASELMERLVELLPQSSRDWTILGRTYSYSGNWQPAIDAFMRANENSTDGYPEAWCELAKVHWRAGNREEANMWFQKFDQWIEQSDSVPVHYLRYRKRVRNLLESETSSN